MKRIIGGWLFGSLMLTGSVSAAGATAPVATTQIIGHCATQETLKRASEWSIPSAWAQVSTKDFDQISGKELPQRFVERGSSRIGKIVGAAVGGVVGVALMGPGGVALGAATGSVIGEVIFEWLACHLFRGPVPWLPPMKSPVVPAR